MELHRLHGITLAPVQLPVQYRSMHAHMHANHACYQPGSTCADGKRDSASWSCAYNRNHSGNVPAQDPRHVKCITSHLLLLWLSEMTCMVLERL